MPISNKIRIVTGEGQDKTMGFYGYMPLGVSEKSISGDSFSYSDFTPRMGDAYGGKVISYSTLQRWFTEMTKYRDKLITDCRSFGSMSEYMRAAYPDEYGMGYISDEDIRYLLHGGDSFYKWLTENYFVLLDLNAIYDDDGYTAYTHNFTYGEWQEIIGSIGTSKLYYPYALDLYGKMSKWHDLYTGDVDCSEEEECCDCVDYRSFGGDNMYSILSTWLIIAHNRIESNNERIKELSDEDRLALYPEIDVPVLLKTKVDDFGVFESIATEYDPKKDYIGGEVAVKDNDVCIYNGS